MAFLGLRTGQEFQHRQLMALNPVDAVHGAGLHSQLPLHNIIQLISKALGDFYDVVVGSGNN
jgi:hypothetical protein